MARKPNLNKRHAVIVRLGDEDAGELARAANLESRRRRERVGKGTLLRELAMPAVREIIAQTETAAA